MFNYDASLKDFLIADAIASETTTATFASGASVKEIQIFAEDGLTVPAAQGNFFFLSKKADGTVVKSDTIYGPNVTRVHKTTAKTEMPEYSYFTVSNTGIAVGDLAEVFMKYWDYSVADWKFKTIPYTTTSTVALTIAAGLCTQIIRNLAQDYYFNNAPTFVFNKAGYAAVYTTEAAALAAVGGLTDNDLVWVISNAKPYTFAASGATFATNFTEKTSWATELGNKTAVTLSQPKYYDVVLDKNAKVYIIAKEIARVADKIEGETAKTYVGASWRDASTDVITEWETTRVGEVRNPLAAKRLAQMELSLDKKQRQYGTVGMGSFYEFPFTPSISTASTYAATLEIDYISSENRSGLARSIANKPEQGTLIVACVSSADADTLLGYVNIAKNGAALTLSDLPAISLNDLSDVTIDSVANTEVLKYNSTSEEWENAADATE